MPAHAIDLKHLPRTLHPQLDLQRVRPRNAVRLERRRHQPPHRAPAAPLLQIVDQHVGAVGRQQRWRRAVPRVVVVVAAAEVALVQVARVGDVVGEVVRAGEALVGHADGGVGLEADAEAAQEDGRRGRLPQLGRAVAVGEAEGDGERACAGAHDGGRGRGDGEGGGGVLGAGQHVLQARAEAVLGRVEGRAQAVRVPGDGVGGLLEARVGRVGVAVVRAGGVGRAELEDAARLLVEVQGEDFVRPVGHAGLEVVLHIGRCLAQCAKIGAHGWWERMPGGALEDCSRIEIQVSRGQTHGGWKAELEREGNEGVVWGAESLDIVSGPE